MPGAEVTQRVGAAGVVAHLYRDYAWETADSLVGKEPPFFEAPAGVIRTYLDSTLVAAVLADRDCEAESQAVCNLDFEPMWDSQDPGGAVASVAATQDPSLVNARVRYPDSAEVLVTYHMRLTSAGWRIADMSGPGWPSLLRLLRQHPR